MGQRAASGLAAWIASICGRSATSPRRIIGIWIDYVRSDGRVVLSGTALLGSQASREVDQPGTRPHAIQQSLGADRRTIARGGGVPGNGRTGGGSGGGDAAAR